MNVEKLSEQIDNLAIITKQGFDHVNNRMDNFELELSKLNTRFNRLEFTTSQRLDLVEDDVRKLKTKLKVN